MIFDAGIVDAIKFLSNPTSPFFLLINLNKSGSKFSNKVAESSLFICIGLGCFFLP